MSGPARLGPAAVRPLPALDDDPPAVDPGRLDWLDRAVDGARVVAIGESAHFNAESYRLRHLLLRHLVERHGFTAYAMESGFVEGLRVDDWIRRPAGPDADAALGAVLARDTTSLMGMFAPQRRLLEWMRATGIRFYGIDTPGSNVSLLPALDLVETYLASADPGTAVDPDLRRLVASTAASSVFAAPEDLAARANLPADRADALSAGLSLLLSRMRARRPEHRDPGNGPGFAQAQRALELAIALDAFQRNPAVNVRDLAQADTVEWILDREERVVLAAHNAHVARWPTEFPGVLPRTTSAGQHLGARLGAGYRVIGVTNGSGSTLATGPGFAEGRFFDELPPPRPGTLDAVMAATHDRPFGVDLGRLDEPDRAVLAAVHGQHSGPVVCPIDPLVAYDVLVHLPVVTAAQPDPAAVDAAPSEVAAAFRRRLDAGG